MKHVPLSSIDFDSATQVRAEINHDVVVDYAERMEAGDKFPLVDLFAEADRYWIGDGWHRLLAAQKNGQVTIPAEVYEGGRIDAIKCALGANITNGLRRTNADKRKAVEVALREFGNLSSVQIAELCGVGHTFVDKIRADSQPAFVAGSTEARLGADGKIRHLPRGESEPREPVPEAPPIGGTSKEIEADAAKVAGPGSYVMPPRGMFLARGAIGELQKILPTDSERIEALKAVRDWCVIQLRNVRGGLQSLPETGAIATRLHGQRGSRQA